MKNLEGIELPPSKDNWEDEDVDQSAVKESWEDDNKEEEVEEQEEDESEEEDDDEEDSDEEAPMVAAEKALNGEEITLDNFIPNSGSEFLEYAELIFHKLRPFQKNYHYIDLVKDVMRLSLSSLKAADVKSIQSSISAILNAKIKAERSAGKKKKGGAKKTQLLVDKPGDDKRINMHEVLDD